jgi:esterase/lipase superfamily enzyme
MGNRALTDALKTLSYELEGEGAMFNEVVLTAPDIDAEVFRRDIAPRIVKTAKRITLYASSNDEALALSKKVHGYPRAGDSGPGLVVIPGIDTIDVSAVDTSLIGHSYYGSNQTVLADLVDLLHESKPPNLRPWLNIMRLGELAYYVFVPDGQHVGTASESFAPVRY